mmetsp:Transcript_5130/g.3812  ORF Transcript_5130/g.3812 Transcript_5130/m.3812 type:complete len:107 (-) Transcript_5130:12-332(-)
MLSSVFSNIPFEGDINENETALRFAFQLFHTELEKVAPFMQNVVLTCAKVLVDERCDEISESFKLEVAVFIKDHVMKAGEQYLDILRHMEANMSDYEREVLAAYLK